MSIDLRFNSLTIEQAKQFLKLAAAIFVVGSSAEENGVDEQIDADQKPKRKRRTKAEMAEDRVNQAAIDRANLEVIDPPPDNRSSEEQAEGPRSQEEDDPPAPRRRKRREATAETAGQFLSRPEPSPKRQRRRKKADDDEISDADVAKAASEGAQRLTPKVVTSILEEFGVGNVAELDQTQRREFRIALDDYEPV